MPRNMLRTAISVSLLSAFIAAARAETTAPHTYRTRFATLGIDAKGFITSLTSRQSGKEYCPVGRPSPLLSLHENKEPNDRLLAPVAAQFAEGDGQVALKYANGATATIKLAAKNDYFRFQLVALEPRGTVDNVVWGPLNTTVSKLIGDLIGVVRDDDWAIGMLGLDDNTIAGPIVEGDCYGMGYYIHSPDPQKYPLPPNLKEGQWFNIGGDGVCDTAFYSHPEEYFQQVYGTGAKLEPAFGSTIAYHARDRRQSYTHLFSLLPGFQRSRPRHQVSDPVAGVDFLGSGIALYACPDDQALATIEKILLGEGLPHITIDGRWIRDPRAFHPQLFWNGPMDKCIEYAKALGMKEISRDTGEFYPSLEKKWQGMVGFAKRPAMTYREFAAEARRHGMTHGGLHTLTVFLQGGLCRDVTPVPSEHLQTICRTRLARDISAKDTELVVTDPSFLAEKGTWTWGDDSNYLRIGGEMLRYSGISKSAPWTVHITERHHASPPAAHKAGEEVVKLQQNCYNGFVPDMTLLLDYAEYYAELMARNDMASIDFDGLESTVYHSHGYYAVRVFMRRLFETYHKLTGAYPHVTGSNVFAGAWEYMDVCNVGGGNNMFDPIGNHWGIEGKDMRNGYANSYFPATFGIQGWHSDWSLYDAENLEAKSIGWNATYSLSTSQGAIEQTGEKDDILTAFGAWEAARSAGAFSKADKQLLKDCGWKFHLARRGEKAFELWPVKELHLRGAAGGASSSVTVNNAEQAQALQLALRVGARAKGCVITLPQGQKIAVDRTIEPGQFVICKGSHAYVADHTRKPLAQVRESGEITLAHGETSVGVAFPGAARVPFELTVWVLGESRRLGQ
jgi:hypothetical protein